MNWLFCFLLLSSPLAATPLIKEMRVEKNRIITLPSDSFQKIATAKKPHVVVYDDPSIDLRELDSSITIMPFLFDVIGSIFRSGQTYTVDALDEDLYESLKRLRSTFQRFYPNTSWDGDILPKELICHRYEFPKERALALFSGGVDASYTALTNLHRDLTLLTFIGQNDSKTAPQLKILREARESPPFNRLSAAEAYSKGAFYIRRNAPLHHSKDISCWGIEAIADLHWIGTTLPLMVLYQIPNLLIGSSEALDCPYKSASSPQFKADFSFGYQIQIPVDDAYVSRIEKTNVVANHFKENCPPHRRNLKVCFDPSGKNCSHCLKCLRTINDLYILGYDPVEFGFKTSRKEAKLLFSENLKTIFKLDKNIWKWEGYFFYTTLEHIQKNHLTKKNAYAKWFYNLLIDHPIIKKYPSISRSNDHIQGRRLAGDDAFSAQAALAKEKTADGEALHNLARRLAKADSYACC